MTTAVDGTPDSNKIDLGFHHPNWDFSNAGTTSLQADFDGNYKVDYNDLAYFTDYWLFDYNAPYQVWLWDFDDSGKVDYGDLMVISEYWLELFNFIDFADFANQWQREVDERLFDGRPDLYKDGRIDFKDFAILANEWGMTGSAEPNIQPVFNRDPNSLYGFVQIGNNILDPYAYRLFVLMDGEKYTEIFDLDEPVTGIQTDSFANGRHSFKIVRIENNKNVICSRPYDVNFNNEISCITADSGYSPEKGYSFYAFGAPGTRYNAEIKNLVNDTVIYSEDFNDNINLKAIASIFTEPYHIYSVAIKRNGVSGFSSFSVGGAVEANQQMLPMAGTNNDEIVKKIMGKKFDPNIIDDGVKMAVTIGSEDVNTWGNLDNIVPAVIKAAVIKQLNPQYLPYEDCTWKNLSRLLKDYPNVTYWYHIGHGNYKIPVMSPSDPNISVNVQRTWIDIKGNAVFSRLKKDYGAGVPPNYQDLGSWESYASIAELGFEANPKLKYVRIYSCYSAKYPDFAVAAGIINDIYYNPLGDRIYIGWNNAAYPGDWYWFWGIPLKPIYYKTFEVEWFYQQSVGSYSVGQAVIEAIMNQPLFIRHFLWNDLYPNIKIWGANQFYFFFGQ